MLRGVDALCGIAGCPRPADDGRTIAVAVDARDLDATATLVEVIVAVCADHHRAVGFTTEWLSMAPDGHDPR